MLLPAGQIKDRIITMMGSLQIVIIAVSLLIGGLSIIFAFRLMRKYRLPYLSTYFYFIVFLYVFSIYGIVGSNMSGIILLNHNLSKESEHAIRLALIFLGVPFLILSWYMFYRFCLELTEQKVSVPFNLVYFITQSILFLGYGYFLIRILQFGEDLYDLVIKLLVIVYTLVTTVTILGGLLQILVHSRNQKNRKVRMNNYLLGCLYIVFFALQVSLLNFSIGYPLVSAVFVFLLFSFHVIPILFLHVYLDKNYVEPEVFSSLEDLLQQFTERFGISKRETEIIEMIWSGKSNQEISDSLFISLQTVKDHVHRIYLKTGVKNRVQLTNLIRVT